MLPALTDLAIVSTVHLGGTSFLHGMVQNIGLDDGYSLVVNWADGDVEQYSYGPGLPRFTLHHTYSDAGSYLVSVTLSDTGTITQTMDHFVVTASPATVTASNAFLLSGTASLASGIPISLRGPTSGVTSGTFTLMYSSSDLAISGALVDPSLAASYGATLSLDASSTPGNAIIDFSTTTALPSASTKPILLGGLVATVASTAYYKAKDLLHFSSVSLNAASGSVAAIGTGALHLVTFPGNASGSGAITSGDALDMARVVAPRILPMFPPRSPCR
jgi:hypothetical protein